jgi:HEAT repeat protein
MALGERFPRLACGRHALCCAMDHLDAYQRLAQGGALNETDDPRWLHRPLQLEAIRRCSASDVAERLGALRVAAWLGAPPGLEVAARLIHDADRAVRVGAFNQAVAAGDLGRPILRDALDGSDEDHVRAALSLLTGAADRPALAAARRLLATPNAAIRAGAATLIGVVGGPSSTVWLRPEAEADVDARAAMALALDRIAGRSPRPEPTSWVDGVGPLPTPMAQAEPPASEGDAPPMEASTALIPSAGTDPVDGPLPSTLPTETRALAKLLGILADDVDQAPVIAALRLRPASELSDLWTTWRAGGEAALGRGMIRAGVALGLSALVSRAAQLSADPEPTVRAEALRALGELAGAGAMPQLRRGLSDHAAPVRAASVRALARLGQRVDRAALAAEWIGALNDDPDADVRAAVAAAKET